MIELVTMKPGEGMSFAGLSRFTAVGPVHNAKKKRALFVLDVWRRELAEGRGDWWHVKGIEGSLLHGLRSLGGLMGVW